MKNPKIPAVHFNTRFITTSRSWFGGGMDVTPSFKDNQEKIFVHRNLKNLCIKNKKIILIIKSGAISIFLLSIEKNQEVLEGFFLIICITTGIKILNL